MSILKCTIQCYLVHTQSWAIIISIKFHSFITLAPIKQSFSIPPYPQQLHITSLLSVSINLPILNVLYNKNHIVCTLLFLVSFTQNNVFMCSVACINTLFFLTLDIPLYKYTILCLLIHQLMGSWVLFTFWLLWTVLLWTLVFKYFLNICFLSFGYAPRNELLNYMLILCLISWETTKLFSTIAPQFWNQELWVHQLFFFEDWYSYLESLAISYKILN